MQVTNKNEIDLMIASCDEMQDGFIMFVGQGKKMIDMCVHRGEDYNLFEIQVFDRRPECEDNDTFFNYSYMTVSPIEEFDVENPTVEYYDDERSAHARIASLIAEHNHF